MSRLSAFLLTIVLGLATALPSSAGELRPADPVEAALYPEWFHHTADWQFQAERTVTILLVLGAVACLVVGISKLSTGHRPARRRVRLRRTSLSF
jgi:hypothetical protein